MMPSSGMLSPLSSQGRPPRLRNSNLASAQPLSAATDSHTSPPQMTQSQIPKPVWMKSRTGKSNSSSQAAGEMIMAKPQGKVVVTTSHPKNTTNRRIISPSDEGLKNNDAHSSSSSQSDDNDDKKMM